MATLTAQTKHVPTLTAQSKSGGTGSINIGNPIGLLLALTYAVSHGSSIGTVLTAQTKS